MSSLFRLLARRVARDPRVAAEAAVYPDPRTACFYARRTLELTVAWMFKQAKLYADCLEARFGQRPAIFYSNGYEHWPWDDHGARGLSVGP